LSPAPNLTAVRYRSIKPAAVLHFPVARAFRHSSPRLSALGEHIVACPPANLHLILDAQRADGEWDVYAFYSVWGSEELTTGLCLEVLARCRQMKAESLT
jgi:hypothetical protein